MVNTNAPAAEIYAAIDGATERITKQMRRYKPRLRDHRAQACAASEMSERAEDYVLRPPVEQGEGGPEVLTEGHSELPNPTDGETVRRMDFANAPMLLFRNSYDELDTVYRRQDGNIGWTDPKLAPLWRMRRGEA